MHLRVCGGFFHYPSHTVPLYCLLGFNNRSAPSDPRKDPVRYRPGLGDWLMWPTIPYLRYSGQRDQAQVRAREAVGIFTALNATDPVTYGPKLEAAKKLLADLQP